MRIQCSRDCCFLSSVEKSCPTTDHHWSSGLGRCATVNWDSKTGPLAAAEQRVQALSMSPPCWSHQKIPQRSLNSIYYFFDLQQPHPISFISIPSSRLLYIYFLCRPQIAQIPTSQDISRHPLQPGQRSRRFGLLEKNSDFHFYSQLC